MDGKIVIEIVSADGSGNETTKEEGKTKKEKDAYKVYDALYKSFHPIQTYIDNVSKGSKTAIEISLSVIKPVASMAFSLAKTDLNRYFTLKEDYMGQNRLNELMTTYNTASTIFNSAKNGLLTGAQLGAFGGPVTSIIGAALGGAFGIARSIHNAKLQTSETMEQYKMQLNATNIQTSFGESRASLINGGRGTEN